MTRLQDLEGWAHAFGTVQGVLMGMEIRERDEKVKAKLGEAYAVLHRLGDQALDLRRDWLRLKVNAREPLEIGAVLEETADARA